MRLYLIRHGETDLNKSKILQGRSDIELNDFGRKLAEETGKNLDVCFDVVYTSPLKRAKETAHILVRESSLKYPDKNLPQIIEDDRIQEISFGDFEGLCYGANFNIPDETFLNFFQAPDQYHTPPNGESLADVIDRTGVFLNEILEDKQNADKTILISTHGCALKAMLSYIRNTPMKEFWGEGVYKNCGISIVEVENGQAIIIEDGKVYYEI